MHSVPNIEFNLLYNKSHQLNICSLISYGLTNGAYQWLLDHNEDQCVILAGHSNSGKTETARLIVHFLTQVAEARRSVAFVEAPIVSHHFQLARPKSTGSVPAAIGKGGRGSLLKKQRSVEIEKVKVCKCLCHLKPSKIIILHFIEMFS